MPGPDLDRALSGTLALEATTNDVLARLLPYQLAEWPFLSEYSWLGGWQQQRVLLFGIMAEWILFEWILFDLL